MCHELFCALTLPSSASSRDTSSTDPVRIRSSKGNQFGVQHTLLHALQLIRLELPPCPIQALICDDGHKEYFRHGPAKHLVEANLGAIRNVYYSTFSLDKRMSCMVEFIHVVRQAA